MCSVLLLLYYSLIYIVSAVAGDGPAGKPLPPGLKIGTSTAAYQIEGAWNKDGLWIQNICLKFDHSPNRFEGRGPSIWDDFTHRYPERILDGSNGDIAANSYELYTDDIKIIKDLGVSEWDESS